MTAEEILHQALRLSEAERATVAHELLASIDPSSEDVTDEEWRQAWGAEIRRRSDALARGDVETVDWREAMSQIRQRMRERRSS